VWIDVTRHGKSTPHWFLPLLVGIITFAFIWVGPPPTEGVDFDYLWRAGRAVLLGENPYAVIRESLPSPFYYPAPGAVVMAPFGFVSRHLAAALFAGLGMGLLCASVSGWRRWIILSAPALQALLFGQWSLLLTAAVGLPWLGFIWAVKPNIGIALFAGWPSRIALIGGAVVGALSFLLIPSWPLDWYEAVRGAPQYTAPVLRPGGLLLLLAWIRWREPSGRLLGLLAFVPHTTGIYEQLPLLLIPQTPRRFAALFGLTHLAAIVVTTVVGYPGGEKIAVQHGLAIQWHYFLALVWLPALYFVLRRPPAALRIDDGRDRGSGVRHPETTVAVRRLGPASPSLGPHPAAPAETSLGSRPE
jgi:hypothetical protein